VNSKAVGGAARASAGVYCLTGIGFTPKNVIVTPGYEGAGISQAAALGARGGCTGVTNTQVSVSIFDANGAPADNDFFITIN
jgi:hypothetical protein